MENEQIFNIEGRKYLSLYPSCPSCGVALEKIPIRKTKCKNCSNFYYSCKRPDSNTYSIVDETTCFKWREENKIHQLITHLENFGVSSSFIDKTKSYPGMSLRNSVWSIFNEALAVNATKFDIQAIIYRMQASFLYEEGKDPYRCLILATEAELIHLEISTTILLDAIIISGRPGKCENCTHLNNQTFLLSEAKILKPIPMMNCEHKYCTACYAGNPRRDKDGFVLTK